MSLRATSVPCSHSQSMMTGFASSTESPANLPASSVSTPLSSTGMSIGTSNSSATR